MIKRLLVHTELQENTMFLFLAQWMEQVWRSTL